MGPADIPPAIEQFQPAHGALTQGHADQVLSRLRLAFPKTEMVEAWPAELPGFVAVRLANGGVAYADQTARFFILGLVFDTHKGTALDGQLAGTSSVSH